MTEKEYSVIDPRERCLARLRECAENYDHEMAHCEADDALLEYINDDAITEAYNAIEKWYA